MKATLLHFGVFKSLAMILTVGSVFLASAEAAKRDGNTTVFDRITNEMSFWMNRHIQNSTLESKLGLADQKLSDQSFISRFREAVSTTDVKFIATSQLASACKGTAGNAPDKIACELQHSTRTCINSVRNRTPKIECIEERYRNRPGDEQYVITLHEYLGVAGIEIDEISDSKEHFSKYPISKRLMKYMAFNQRLGNWSINDQVSSASIRRESSVFKNPCRELARRYETDINSVTFLRCSKMDFVQAFKPIQTAKDADVCLAISENGKYVALSGSFYYPAVEKSGLNAQGGHEIGVGALWTRLRSQYQVGQVFSSVKGDRYLPHYFNQEKLQGRWVDTYGSPLGKFSNLYEMNPDDGVMTQSFSYQPNPLTLHISQTGRYVYNRSGILGPSNSMITSVAKIDLEAMTLSYEFSGPESVNTGSLKGLKCSLEPPQ